jgi:NADP-dependent 3-hydroxy acid dehydrogenase YdfG
MAAPDALKGRLALVTGASSGIGRVTARLLAAAGADVVATARRDDLLETLRVEGAGRITPIAGDLVDAAFIERLARRAGPVDVLVNAAGALKHAPFLESNPEDWAPVWRLNVESLLRLTQLVARGMVERKRGHIVNISSVVARRSYRHTVAYAASKAAVRQITPCLRVELAPHGIKVTEIAPGLVDTDVFGSVDHPDVIAAYRNRGYKPLQPEDVANAIVGAVATADNASPDVIEINPVLQTN